MWVISISRRCRPLVMDALRPTAVIGFHDLSHNALEATRNWRTMIATRCRGAVKNGVSRNCGTGFSKRRCRRIEDRAIAEL